MAPPLNPHSFSFEVDWDREAGEIRALYWTIRPHRSVAKTVQISDVVLVDLDPQERVLGIELIGPQPGKVYKVLERAAKTYREPILSKPPMPLKRLVPA